MRIIVPLLMVSSVISVCQDQGYGYGSQRSFAADARTSNGQNLPSMANKWIGIRTQSRQKWQQARKQAQAARKALRQARRQARYAHKKVQQLFGQDRKLFQSLKGSVNAYLRATNPDVRRQKAARILDMVANLKTEKFRKKVDQFLAKKGLSLQKLQGATQQPFGDFYLFKQVVRGYAHNKNQKGRLETVLVLYDSLPTVYKDLARLTLRKYGLTLAALHAAYARPATTPEAGTQQEVAQVEEQLQEAAQVVDTATEALEQEPTSVPSSSVAQILDQLTTTLADAEEVVTGNVDPRLESQIQHVEAQFARFIDTVHLHKFLQQADTLLASQSGAITSKTHAEAYLLRDALNDALDDYKQNSNGSRSLVTRAAQTLDSLSSLIRRLQATPLPVHSGDPVVKTAIVVKKADALLDEAAAGTPLEPARVEPVIRGLEADLAARIHQNIEDRFEELRRYVARNRVAELRDRLEATTQTVTEPAGDLFSVIDELTRIGSEISHLRGPAVR